MKIGNAHVATIEANRFGDRSEKARVTATYEIGNVLGSIAFDVEIAEARIYYVGQRLSLHVEIEEPMNGPRVLLGKVEGRA